jgi:hypothetical protein
MTKAISLSAELSELRNAVEGARFIANALAVSGLEDRQSELRAPLSITAVLVLVELRIQLIERILRGEENPLDLWAPHNDTTPVRREGDDPAVVLHPWSHAEEDAKPPTRKKPARSRPRGKHGKHRPPTAVPPGRPESGGEQPPPEETPS